MSLCIGILLFGLASFLLGGIFVYTHINEVTVSNEPISFDSLNQIGETNINAVFASSRGSKYYTKFCSGGKNIKIENIIWFQSSQEAEKAGYTIAAACK